MNTSSYLPRIHTSTRPPHTHTFMILFIMLCKVVVTFEVWSMKSYTVTIHSDESFAAVLKNVLYLSVFSTNALIEDTVLTSLTGDGSAILRGRPSHEKIWPFGINLGFRETAHLPFPQVNINTYFSLRAKCWIRGGIGGQFPRSLNWSAVCRAKAVPSILSHFKTLSIGLGPGIEPGTSRSTVKRSTDWIFFSNGSL